MNLKELETKYARHIDAIRRKSVENIKLTEKEIEDIVQDLKKCIDFKVNVDLSVFPKEIKDSGLFQFEKDINLCNKYFIKLMLVQKIRDELNSQYIESLQKIENSTPNQNYIENIYIPSVLFLEEKYQQQDKEIKTLYNLYDEKSKQWAIQSFKTEREKQYGFLAITNVPEIEEKYNRLREDVSKNNNPKHLKITEDKLDYLYVNKEVDITTTIHGLQDKKELIIKSFCDINVYRSSLVSLYKMKKLLDTLECVVELINKKYDNIIEKKDFNKKVVYFSNMEHLTIAEICELMEEFIDVVNRIKDELENAVEDKEYLASELDIFSENKVKDYENFLDESRIKELYYYALDSEDNIRNFLPWIFSKDEREKPFYCY